MSYRYPGHILTALARQDGRLLMVQQQGPDEAEPVWALPGGRVKPGKPLLDALARELHEETGLALTGTPHVAFAVQLLAQAGAGMLEEIVAVAFSCQVVGAIQPCDPDGFVLSAAWIEEPDALDRLALLSWYDPTPLQRWLNGSAAPGTVYTLRRQVGVQTAIHTA